MRRTKLLALLGILALAGFAVIGSLSHAARPGPRPIPGPIGACPNPGYECLDVWNPVTCDNGVTYSNQCYADRACAKNCVAGYPAQ